MAVTMQRCLATALLLFFTIGFSSGDDGKPITTQLPATEEATVKSLKALGGKVIRDEATEGKPVVGVDLNGIERVTDEELQKLRDLKSLKTLQLIQTQVTDAGLKELKDLNNLRELRLDATQVSDVALKELKNLKSLRMLGLSGTQVTDAGLKELKELKNLQELRLGGTQVTDAGLKELKGFKELRTLGLAGTQVTDAGLKELKDLKELQDLRLDGTQMSDAGLQELQQLKELRQLNVANTKVTRTGADDLQKILPELTIVPWYRGEQVINFNSKHLGKTRGVKIYLPPGHDRKKSYPVVYCADGGGSDGVVDQLITSRKIPPIIIVGIEHGGNMRAAEYIPTLKPNIFNTHEKFFIEEVMPWAEREYGASRERKDRAIIGGSNGGPFALTMANRHPDLFGHVFAFAVYGLDMNYFDSNLKEQPKDPTHYILAVGSEDRHGVEQNKKIEKILKKKNFPVSSFIIEGVGHGGPELAKQFPICLEMTFGKKK